MHFGWDSVRRVHATTGKGEAWRRLNSVALARLSRATGSGARADEAGYKGFPNPAAFSAWILTPGPGQDTNLSSITTAGTH